jgi:hypothetical protein
MRDHQSWVQSNQKATPADTQTQLIDAVGCASAVLDALERL